MKLIFCPDCKDVFKLDYAARSCKCGKATGKYVDKLNVVHTGGIPLGFANSSLQKAIDNRPQFGMGATFEAFVIPQNCPTVNQPPNVAIEESTNERARVLDAIMKEIKRRRS